MDGRVKKTWNITYRAARRVAIAVIGTTVVLLGVAMLVLPGPGLLTIVGGLAILGMEFAFARRWLQRLKKETRSTVEKVKERVRRKRTGTSAPPEA